MQLIILSALAVGSLHTILGPDHYLPFIALAHANKWSLQKTLGITTICGLGHILAAVPLSLLATKLGMAKLQHIEAFRNSIAAWLLIGVGFAYVLWGLRHALTTKHTFTSWILFIIFVLGPCEPLIPLIMIQNSILQLTVVTLSFGAATLLVMLGAVSLGYRTCPLHYLGKYQPAVAGAIVCGSGLAIKFLGI